MFLNSLWGIFLYPQVVFAEEATESAELELIEEVVSTPEPSPTPLPSAELAELEDPVETEPVELLETLSEELEESPTVEESASLVVSLWTENEDGSVITSSAVGEGVEYYYKDTEVKVVFTKLTEPGYLTIREFEPESADELGILGKAYEITSDMEDGTFEYNLTLPIPSESKDNLSVKYSENLDQLSSAQPVDQPTELGENTITINGLDHFTFFVVVYPVDMATNYTEVVADTSSWFFYNDETDVIDNSLGSFVTGPDTAPEGSGSVQISVFGTQRRNLATYQFGGTKLADITTLKFSTYNPSVGNGGSTNRSGYLNFNVTFDGADTWQKRLAYVPSQNGTVVQDSWQSWDAINSGAAQWWWSGYAGNGNTWPDGNLSEYRTWSDLLSSFSNIAIRTNDSWFGIRVGEPYSDGYTENIDAFKFGTSTETTTFNFEPTLVDTTPPTIIWVTPNDGDKLKAPVLLQANANETLENLRFKWKLSGGSWNSGHNINENNTDYSWDFTPAVDGVYTLKAQGRDLALNWNKASDIEVLIDNTIPTGQILTPTDSELINGDLNITGWVDDNLAGIDRVEVRLRNIPSKAYLTPWQTATLDGLNNYSAQIDTTSIPDDDYEVVVVAYDKTGNNKWLWPRPVITVDNTGPLAPTITSPVVESYLNSTPILNQWTPVVDPSGIDYYRIQYEYDDHHTFSGYPYRTTSSTSRNHTPGLGEQGGVEFRVQAFDSLGNEGVWSDWRHYYYDATSPSVPILTWPIGGTFTNDNTPLMQWDPSTDNIGVAGYLYRIFYNCFDTNDQSSCSNLYPNTLGLWLTNFEYQAGPTLDNAFLWQVQSQDLANNQSGWSDHEQFTIDTVAPTQPTGLKFLSADESTEYQCGDVIPRQVNIPVWDEYTGSDFDYYEYSSFHPSGAQGLDEKILYTEKLTNSWMPPTDGAYGFSVRTVDKAGNKSPWSLSGETLGGSCQIVYDSVAPVVDITNPSAGTVTGTVEVRGTLIDDNPYRYYAVIRNSGGSVVAGPGTVYSSSPMTDQKLFDWDTILLPDGDYLVHFAARDQAMNRDAGSQDQVAVTVDNSAPVSTITAPTGPDYFNSTFTISGNTTDNIGLASVQLSSASYTDSCGTFTNITTPILISGVSDNWDYDWTPDTEGDYCIKAAGTDLAGNVESSAVVSNIIYDTTDPILVWTSPVQNTIISGTTVILSVATDNLSGVESVVYSYQRDDGIDVWHEIAILTNSPYEVSWDTTGLALDDYNLKAVVTDRAGNIFEDTRRVGVAAVVSNETWSRPGWGEITITWTTDRPTDGRVVYDTVSHSIDLSHPNYGYTHSSGTVDISPKTLSHTITLSGLTNSETYYWRTVSGGSPKVISAERRGDTFSIPGGDTGGGGIVVGVTTSATTAPFPYAEPEETSTPEEDSEEVLGEETEIVAEEPETPLDEAIGILSRTTKGRILAISAFLLGLILYFISKRRRE